MANKTINELSQLVELSSKDELAIYDYDTGSTGKITVGTLSNVFASRANVDGKQDKLTAGNGINLDSSNNISVKLATTLTDSTIVAATPKLVKDVDDKVYIINNSITTISNDIDSLKDKIDNKVSKTEADITHYKISNSAVFDYHGEGQLDSLHGLNISSEDENGETKTDWSLQWKEDRLALRDNIAESYLWSIDPFMVSNDLMKVYNAGTTNINDLKSPGIYFLQPKCGNAPSSQFGLLTVYRRKAANWIFQRWQNIQHANSNQYPLCYERTYSSEAWSPWKLAYDGTVFSTTNISEIITVNSTNAIIKAAQYTQCGKIAQLHIEWNNKKAITVPATGNIDNVEVGQLVAGKRPAVWTAAHSHGDLMGAAWYSIPIDGIIKLGACDGTGAARTLAAQTGDITFHIFTTYILP